MPLSDLFLGKPDDPEELKKLKRQQRTAKARAASQLTFQKRKLEAVQQAQHHHPENPDDEEKRQFQRQFLASSVTQWNPVEDVSGEVSDNVDQNNARRRAVYLYFKSFAKAVRCLFLGPPQAEKNQECPKVSHVISININDDTNVRLGSGKRGSSEVRSVMNNIQQHVVVKTPLAPQDMPAAWFRVHQPLVALERADTSNLYTEFMSWVLGFAGYVGWRFHAWGVPRNLFCNVQQHVMCFVGDALKVNDSLFQRITQAVHESQGDDQTSRSFALQIHCGIHQIGLTRKTLALGFHNYWSTLVRLGHLFSSHAFRQKFRASMVKIVQQDFQFVEVAQLPPQVEEWNQLKIQQLKLYADTGHMGFGGGARRTLPLSKRMKALTHHMQKDNGDPRCDSFTHWCTGASCCPGGKDEALASMIDSFLDLFDYMVVPLLYRWKHAMAANNFVRDGFFWHRILPRALQAMPALKCHLVDEVWFLFSRSPEQSDNDNHGQ